MLKKKNLLSLILALCLCYALAAPAWAADDDIYEEKNVDVNGYTFNILEKVNNEDFTIIKTYINPTPFSMERNSVDIERAKALLIALGMDEGAIALWDDETILAFANAEKITSADSYYKTDDEKNIVTQLPKDVAISEAAVLSEQQKEEFFEKALNQQDGDIELYGSKEFNNGYIKVYHAAAYQGGHDYIFSTDSLWLTMPRDRGYDSISASSQATNIEYDDARGSWGCRQTYVDDGNVTEKYISGTNFERTTGPNLGSWSGAAGIFKLFSDAASSGTSVKYDDFRTHYQYKGGIVDYGSNKEFTCAGIYSHARAKLNVVPSFSFPDDSLGFGISLNYQWQPVDYVASFRENYIAKN